MRRFLLVFLSLQIVFTALSATPLDEGEDSSSVWEYLLGDWDYEIDEGKEFDHNAPEPYYSSEEIRHFQISSKNDPKKPNPEEPNLALMTLEAPPASMVAGCVSAISGSFVDSHIGLVVPGALPLIVQCTYCSSEKKWHFRHKPKFRAGLSSGRNHINIGYLDDQGSGIPFRGDSSKKAISFFIPSSVFETGVTNCGSSEINGRTNLKNQTVHFVRNEYGKCYSLLNGSHTKRIFSYVKGGERHRKGAPLGKFCLRDEMLPNGNQIKYRGNCKTTVPQKIDDFGANSQGQLAGLGRADEALPRRASEEARRELASKGRFSEAHEFCNYLYSYNKDDKLIKIKALSGANTLGSIEIEEPKDWHIHWKSNSGKVSYAFSFDQKRLYQIDPTHALSVSYEYDEDDRVNKKNLPEGRFLKVSYHDYHDSWRHKPVHQLWAPVGDDDKPVCTHTFTYEKDAKIEVHTTTVRDAVGNKTLYTYGDKNKRLRSIRKLDGSKTYTNERFFWSDIGNLKTRCFQDEGNHAYFCRGYEYDRCGNVAEERTWGNLTGKHTLSLHLKRDGRPDHDSYEVFIKKRTFTEDGRNLLSTEDDGRKIITCTYHSNSNLLKSRLTSEGEKVLKREFFEYSCGVVVKEVWDDGTSPHQDDPAGVTERHEKQTTLNSIGLPEVAAEYCNHRLLKKQENAYSPQGLLKEQKHYGSDGMLAYTLYWDYNPLGNVIKEVNALREESLFSYDANGNKTYEQGPDQELCKEYGYDFANRLIKEVEIWKDGRRFTTTHRYNSLNQRIATTDIYGNETRFIYDILGRLIEKQLPPAYDEKGSLVIPVEKTQYDPMGNIIAKWDAKGNCIKRQCTIRGNPYHIEYPDGSREEKYYTLDGLPECEIAKNGLVKTYSYDALGRVAKTEIKDPKGIVLKTITSTYNTFHLISETDEVGLTTSYTYDPAGRRASMTKGDHVTYYKYDPLGRNVETIEKIDQGHSRVTFKEYDLLDRIVEERIEDGEILQKKQYCYDVHGNRTEEITHTHAGKSIAKTTYLPNGEPLTLTDPLGNTTHIHNDYAFYHQGQSVRRTTITDPLGNQEIKTYDTHQRVSSRFCRNPWGVITQRESYIYDLLGRKVASHATVYFPDKEPRVITTEWQYDMMGNITCCKEAKGTKEEKITRYHYNLFGQKERSELPNGIILKHSYDALGLLKTYSSSDGTISYEYTYDAKDHPVFIEDHIRKTASKRVYDGYGRLTSETLDHGQTLTTAYDALDRPISVTLPDASTIQYQYNALYLTAVKRGAYTHRYEQYDLAGNVSIEHLAGQAGTIKYTYDLLERAISTITSHREERLLDFDAAGNLLKRQVDAKDYTYAYDDLYQLISETGPQNHTYQNDSLYNRRKKNESAYTLNDLNQLLQQREWSYQYDPNGNLKLKSSDNEKVEYRYDALDRLIEVKSGSEVTTYTYDSFHRRLAKTTNGTTTHFLYQGQNEIGAISNGKINELRVLGITRGAEIGSSVLFEIQGQVFVPIHDVFGNVVTLLDLSGNLIESYNYSAFGEMKTFGNSAVGNPWLFSSKRLDPETGFYFFSRRYYAPDIGRFITPDPLGFKDGPNLYTYAHNHPLAFIDPDGQFAALLVPMVTSFLISTAIGMTAEAALPYAVAALGESAAGIACAAFLTGMVKGYNGSVLEGNSFDGAGWEASFCEYSGKAVGSVLSCTNPRGLVNGGGKIVANVAAKEAAHVAEKAIVQKVSQTVVSSMTKNTVNQTGKKTLAIAERELLTKVGVWGHKSRQSSTN
jgi:RHS repeat-associated protein